MTARGGSAGGARILGGRYRLDEVIGRGGMSTVYRGTDLALDRVVAVKVALDPQAEENPVYVARFKREARAAAALNHPGAVTVFDAGADGPTRFIVMEYVEGRSLADILREHQPLEPARAAHIAELIADTLAAAHAAGIIHRDIKPGNVMVMSDGAVKVLDFGIARWVDSATLTQTAAVLGTAPYMSPEQAMGNPADARSDLYSLGCVLYEMLTGQPPFMADLPAGVLHQHVRVAAKPPSQLIASIPPALDALVVQMLAKSPDDRPQTAAEVRDRLAEIHSQLAAPPTAATEPLPAIEPLAATEPLPGIEAREPAAPVGESLAAAAAAAAAVPQVATVPQPGTVPHGATVDAPRRRRAARDVGDAGATAATERLSPPGPPPRRRGAWIVAAAIVVLLAGAAVAFALTGGGSTHSSSTGRHPAPPASTRAGGSTSHSATAPQSSSTTSSTSTASTTTTTVTTTATAPTTSTPTAPAPPAQGGGPPGHAKKKKKK